MVYFFLLENVTFFFPNSSPLGLLLNIDSHFLEFEIFLRSQYLDYGSSPTYLTEGCFVLVFTVSLYCNINACNMMPFELFSCIYFRVPLKNFTQQQAHINHGVLNIIKQNSLYLQRLLEILLPASRIITAGFSGSVFQTYVLHSQLILHSNILPAKVGFCSVQFSCSWHVQMRSSTISTEHIIKSFHQVRLLNTIPHKICPAKHLISSSG